MKTVLVAGTCNITGMNVVRALLKRNLNKQLTGRGDVRLIGYDCEHLNPTNMWIQNSVVPRTTDEGYLDTVMDICTRENVTHVIPSNDHDVRALQELVRFFHYKGIRVNGFGLNTLMCLDKVATVGMFLKHGIKTPDFVSERDVNELAKMLPLIFRKASMGGSKKFTHIIHDERELRYIYPTIQDDCVINKVVKGPEFTIDVLCDENSEPVSIVPRQRLVVKHAAIHHGKLVNDKKLIELCGGVARKMKLVGMNCMQCILQDGEYYFFEVNPRPGSGLDMTVQGGANFPSLWLDIQDKKSMFPPTINWNLQMVRFQDGYFIT